MRKPIVVIMAILGISNIFAENNKYIITTTNETGVVSYEISSITTINDLNTLFGPFTGTNIGDGNSVWHEWKDVEGNKIFDAYFKNNKLAIVILRTQKYYYLGLSQKSTIEEALKVIPNPYNDQNAGKNYRLVFFNNPDLRIDYNSATRLIMSIFLFFQ